MVLFLLLLIWAAVTVIWAKIASHRGEQMFDNAMAELNRRGMAVDPQTIRKQHGIDQETWRLYRAAHSLVQGWYTDFYDIEQLGVGVSNIPLGQHIEPEMNQRLEEFAAEYGLPFELFDRVIGRLESPSGEVSADATADIPYEDLLTVRSSSGPWFMLSWVHQAKGDGNAALDACSNGLKLSRVVDGYPSVVMSLIRVATGGSCVSTTEQVLSRTTPSSEDLRRLRNAMLAEDELISLQRMLEGELALLAEQSRNPDLTMAENTDTAIRSYQMAMAWASNFREDFQDEQYGPQISEFVIESTGLEKIESLSPSRLRMLLGVSWLWHWLSPGSIKAHSSRQILRGLDEYDALEAPNQELAKRAVAAEKRDGWKERLLSPLALLTILEGKAALRVGAAALAIEEYRVDHGGWPKDLSGLNIDLQPDPFTGVALTYRRNTDGCIVYSVGPNLTDDGGEHDTMEPDYDIVFRLLDTNNRNH